LFSRKPCGEQNKQVILTRNDLVRQRLPPWGRGLTYVGASLRGRPESLGKGRSQRGRPHSFIELGHY